MTFYHGTSFECAMGILTSGFGNNTQAPVWNCSDTSCTYLWKRPENEPEEFAVEQAACSAIAAAAKYDSQYEKIVVFTLDIPDDLAEGWVMQDHSCENMYGAFCTPNGWLRDKISTGVIKITAETCKAYLLPFRMNYLAGCCEEYMDLSEDEERYLRIAEKANEVIYEDLFDGVYGDWALLHDVMGVRTA